REKPSASAIRVTVLPVPGAPATRPWRLANPGCRKTPPPASGRESGVVTALPTRIGSMGAPVRGPPDSSGMVLPRVHVRGQACRPLPLAAGGRYPAGSQLQFPVSRMSPRFAVLSRLALAAAVAALAFHVPEASAQSRRDRVAAGELVERMAAAEARYRDSLVRAANADPEAIAQGDAALEDMEDVMLACEKQRGCQVSTLMPAFKRLLKAQADDASGVDSEDTEAELLAEGELPTGDVPEGASAAVLLSEDG